ncbi:MAG TPA: hypothetical protein VJ253_03175 [Dehalococcoidia bacterium]|nr:hypothetical protein [Dehalococcoidia bacterium]
MAKSNGLGWQLYVGGYDLSNDIGQLGGVGNERALLVVTGIDKSAEERIHGVQTAVLTFTGFFNDAAGQEHIALRDLPTTNREVILMKSATIAVTAAGITGKQIGYSWARGADGSLGIQSAIHNDGDQFNWGLSLTAGKRTDTGATNGAGVDFGTGSTTFGLVAYLNVFAFAGTSVTVTIQESSDNGGADPFAAVTGGAFAAVSAAPADERIQTVLTQTVERYLRAVTTGTFSSAQFAVVAKRYALANTEA